VTDERGHLELDDMGVDHGNQLNIKLTTGLTQTAMATNGPASEAHLTRLTRSTPVALADPDGGLDGGAADDATADDHRGRGTGKNGCCCGGGNGELVGADGAGTLGVYTGSGAGIGTFGLFGFGVFGGMTLSLVTGFGV